MRAFAAFPAARTRDPALADSAICKLESGYAENVLALPTHARSDRTALPSASPTCIHWS